MTGIFTTITEMQKERIKKLTGEGLSADIIAQRLGLKKHQVHYYQKKSGLRGVNVSEDNT